MFLLSIRVSAGVRSLDPNNLHFCVVYSLRPFSELFWWALNSFLSASGCKMNSLEKIQILVGKLRSSNFMWNHYCTLNIYMSFMLKNSVIKLAKAEIFFYMFSKHTTRIASPYSVAISAPQEQHEHGSCLSYRSWHYTSQQPEQQH